MRKTYTVSLTFEGLSAEDPLEAVKNIHNWICEGVSEMIFEVKDEETQEMFTVDLAESDEDAVLPIPKVDPTQCIYVTNVCTSEKKVWGQLLDKNGDPFTSMADAIAYVRREK